MPDINDPYLIKLLGWADEFRRLEVWANADYPRDAERARDYGAEGIGLCRTEHMFFETERLPLVQQMILAKTDAGARRGRWRSCCPSSASDFDGLFRAMDGLPVIIRLIDPPLHEFLPGARRARCRRSPSCASRATTRSGWPRRRSMLAAVECDARGQPDARPARRAPGHPHAGADRDAGAGDLRGGLPRAPSDGIDVHPEVMIPLTAHVNELKVQQTALEAEAQEGDGRSRACEVDYKFGTMIEIPRAALTADEIAAVRRVLLLRHQRPDPDDLRHLARRRRAGFLIEYLEKGILPENPFASDRRARAWAS